jgi:FkbM family methyltransferase
METRAEGGLDRIVHDRFFRGAPGGVFVDVGAARPDYLSMSAFYRSAGWRVIAIEPNPAFCAAHRTLGHEVLEYACADYDADDVSFEVVDSRGAPYEGGEVSFESFSSLGIKDSYRALREGDLDVTLIEVRVRRLDWILQAHVPDLVRPEIVSIDVEGWEPEVLQGFSVERYRPKVLIVENVFADGDYRGALAARGYRLWRHVPPNDVYVPARPWRRRRRLPSATPDRRVRFDMHADPAWVPPFGDEPIVSYSQNAEDVRLWRVFRTIEAGFYVDVGAADPDVDSVTRLFYENGWSGINVEPSPLFDALETARPRDVNLRIAVGESDESVPFFVTRPFPGMSTLDLVVHTHVASLVERVDEVRVPQRRLASILEEHARDRIIHFLKVDVEGAEYQVLASADWALFRPVVVVVESIESLSTSPTHQKWETILLDVGYRFAAFDGINRFYVDTGYDELVPVLAYPVSALDKFVPAVVRDLEKEVGRWTSEAESLRRTLDSVYRSRTWRAGSVIAKAARPLLTVWKRLPRIGSE